MADGWLLPKQALYQAEPRPETVLGQRFCGVYAKRAGGARGAGQSQTRTIALFASQLGRNHGTRCSVPVPKQEDLFA